MSHLSRAHTGALLRARTRGRRRRGAPAERARGGDELHAGAPPAEPDPVHRHPRQRGLVPRHRVVAPQPAGALVGELRRQPHRARAGARAAARHRLACGQLGLQRALGRHRERGLHRRARRASRCAEYRATARIAAVIARRSLIPIDRRHIIGHYQVPDPNDPLQGGGIDNHTDPGTYWRWNLFMRLVSASRIRSASSGTSTSACRSSRARSRTAR